MPKGTLKPQLEPQQNITLASLSAEKRSLLEKWGVVRDFPVHWGKEDGRDVLEGQVCDFSAGVLRKLFYHESSRRFDLQGLLHNVIWQAYTEIKNGFRDLVGGNLRTFWYSDVKSALWRLELFKGDPDSLLAPRTRGDDGRDSCDEDWILENLQAVSGDGVHVSTSFYLYDQMTRAIDDFVANHIFSFRDFGFKDHFSDVRWIGKTRAGVIFAAEKDGFQDFAQEIHDSFDCTGICLGGQPKLIATEYFTEALSAAIPLGLREFLILACVDYDPPGWNLAEEFAKQLAYFGLTRSKIVELVTADILTKGELERKKLKLSPTTQTRATIIKRWVERTGGVNGEAFGFESDVVPKDRIRDRVGAEIEKAERTNGKA